jgi:asparagine synthase (glutamine-hydrolysing)
MCGIAGWSLKPGRSADPAWLTAMRRAIVHRGPDDEGESVDAQAGVALGFQRLAILDLTPASGQPMADTAAGVAMIFNGELYNFASLRRELEAEGVAFSTRGDVEVMLRAFVAWRQAAFARYCGMFAVAFHERSSGTVWLARDALGMKPLYLAPLPDGAGIAFASEVKAFLALPGFAARLRPEGLRQFLELGFVFDENDTILEGVGKLAPGEVVGLREGRIVERRRHFSPPLPEPADERGEAERVDELAATLEQVVAEHLVADVPVGVLLSGGIDSSLVAALAARRGELTTVSMGFTDSTHDERPWAERVARHIGSRHLAVGISPAEVAAEVTSAAWVFDDLFADWGTVTTRILYRKCRELGLKVALVGEGADELFAGYPVFEAAAGAASGLPGAGTEWAHFQLYRRYASRRWGALYPRFRTVMRDIAAEVDGDLFETVRRFEVTRQLPNNYVMKVDKASMSVSLEARAPYLDRRVAEIAFRTPREWLLRSGRNKHLLRCVAERLRLLPPEIAGRPKMGGSIAATWLEEVPQFQQFARETVLAADGFAGRLGLRPAMERFFDGRGGYRFPRPLSILGHLAWRLLLLELWSRHYLQERAA